MRLIIAPIMLLFLSSCSSKYIASENATVIKSEKKIELNLLDINGENDLKEINKFIREVKAKSPKARFVVQYKSSESISSIIARLHEELMVNDFEIKDFLFSINEKLSDSDIIVSSTMYGISQYDCGVFSFETSSDYRFGCSITYNILSSLADKSLE